MYIASDLLLKALGGVDEVIEGHVPLFCHLYEGSQLGGDLLVLAGPLPVLLQLCLKTKQLRLEVCDADLLFVALRVVGFLLVSHYHCGLAVFLCIHARLTPPRVGGGLGYGRWQGRSGGEYGKVVQEVRGKEIRRRVVIAADWIRTFWEKGTYFDMSELTIRFLGAKSALRTMWEIVVQNA